MGRFPVTLYQQQWEKLLGMADEIREFIAENKHKTDRHRRKITTSRRRCAPRRRSGFSVRKRHSKRSMKGRHPMMIGYARVSTDQQDYDAQVAAWPAADMKRAGSDRPSRAEYPCVDQATAGVTSCTAARFL